MPDTPVSPSGRAGPALLDVLRGLAMTIVLYGHALEIFFLDRPDGLRFGSALIQYKALASFTMPLFFLVSGAAAASLGNKGWRGVARTSLFLVALASLVHWLGVFVMAAGEIAGPGPGWRLFAYGLEANLKGRDFSTIVVWFLVSLAIVRMIAFALMSRLDRPGLWGTVALLMAASFVVPFLPHSFMMRTWFAGTAFFLVGALAAPWLARVPPWSALALAPAVALLALANRGCAFDPLAVCPLPRLGDEAVVWLHAGEVGFPPLFYLTALLGCTLSVAFGRALIEAGLARGLAWLGRRTLELLIVNGFVLVFLQPKLKLIPLGEAAPLLYPLLLAAVIGLHWLALRALERPLAWLQRLALRLADLGLRLLARAPAPKARAVTELSRAQGRGG